MSVLSRLSDIALRIRNQKVFTSMFAAADSKTKFVFKLPFKIVSEEQSYNKRRNHRGKKMLHYCDFLSHVLSLSLSHTCIPAINPPTHKIMWIPLSCADVQHGSGRVLGLCQIMNDHQST